jgi:predicted membrane channel-forming protein YqfA (hemolysin III family)
MKILFALFSVITSTSGGYLLLTAPSTSHVLLAIILILTAIICLLFLIIKDYRQQLDFWKRTKTFIFVIALTSLFTACSGPNKIKCPSDTSWETSRKQNLK